MNPKLQMTERVYKLWRQHYIQYFLSPIILYDLKALISRDKCNFTKLIASFYKQLSANVKIEDYKIQTEGSGNKTGINLMIFILIFLKNCL